MLTVLISYLIFGEFCYAVYGANVQTIVISDLPSDTNFNIGFKAALVVIFIVNLFFTYPLVIYPANMVVEQYLFGKWPKSKKRQWSKNAYRSLIVLGTVVLSLALGNELDRFLSLLGALACTPIAFTLPTWFHYRLAAKTTF